MPGAKGRTGTHGRQGRRKTDIRNLTATPPELALDNARPVTATADVTLWWCPHCRSAWWEATEVRYWDEAAELAATATIQAQAEHHIGKCPNQKDTKK